MSQPLNPSPLRSEERPAAETVWQEVAYLTESLPPWLQAAIQAHLLRRMPRWAAHHLRKHS